MEVHQADILLQHQNDSRDVDGFKYGARRWRQQLSPHEQNLPRGEGGIGAGTEEAGQRASGTTVAPQIPEAQFSLIPHRINQLAAIRKRNGGKGRACLRSLER